ncbi:MAG: hypothetical protein A3H98_03685 [Bacteroidetes bacterium RIFCSPLOWO2_02_FULL_36_8]|nr:MAG: hypothetical protein A3H98_03685 [Bacteroidetes bacterium RIFCSPLOWO2_02_FULL_36_8]OFY69543.1 MAG: hypothetical protein A3G23_10930 [Bacteroidetes bacterium RIFCSPLOWO2_12_FULL_37_12]
MPQPQKPTPKKGQPKNNYWYFYIVAFIEGGAVMACELLGAKMIAPYYGNSLYVWSSVLGTTLGGLTAGYFVGGYLSEKYPKDKTLLVILLISTLLFAGMPVISKGIMTATLSMSVQMGSLISCMVFVFPPLMCFGMVSPMIIRLISDEVKEVGKNAGTVYAVSTVGGILATFIFGFYIIPYLGLRFGAYFTACLLGAATVFYFMISKKKETAVS